MTLALDAGMMQQLRPIIETALHELYFIMGHHKDMEKNLNATSRWFLSQPNFNNKATSYRNNAFIYDSSNENFRELMTSYRAHYSQEEDSWRDQPHNRYLVNKNSNRNCTPRSVKRARKARYEIIGKKKGQKIIMVIIIIYRRQWFHKRCNGRKVRMISVLCAIVTVFMLLW